MPTTRSECFELNGHLLYAIPAGEHTVAREWLEHRGILALAAAAGAGYLRGKETLDAMFDSVAARFLDAWEDEAGLKTFGEAVAEVIEFRTSEGQPVEIKVNEWRRFAARASFCAAREKARELGVDVDWDCEMAKTPEGYYQVRGGIPYAIAKSLAAAPFADLLWMETKTANLDDAREFAEAIHAEFPDKMLAYNLSPSFSWNTTGMSDEEMRHFPEELGKLGFVFNFITYGGHQIDGLAAEEFAVALKQDGMLALARLQRKLRMVESPYRTPQTLVEWKVNSASTSHLMEGFYKDLESYNRKSKTQEARALQAAALRLMKDPKYRHPFYWAGFVLIGGGY